MPVQAPFAMSPGSSVSDLAGSVWDGIDCTADGDASDGSDAQLDTGLERFIRAQNRNHSYSRAVQELYAGQRKTNWVPWVFPQLRRTTPVVCGGYYGLRRVSEAQAYLKHDLLRTRLVRAFNAAALAETRAATAANLMGRMDAVSLHSSTTLFAEVARSLNMDARPFERVLHIYWGGAREKFTKLALVGLHIGLHIGIPDDAAGPDRVPLGDAMDFQHRLDLAPWRVGTKSSAAGAIWLAGVKQAGDEDEETAEHLEGY